jgi:hypothetical protein
MSSSPVYKKIKGRPTAFFDTRLNRHIAEQLGQMAHGVAQASKKHRSPLLPNWTSLEPILDATGSRTFKDYRYALNPYFSCTRDPLRCGQLSMKARVDAMQLK